MRFDKYGGNTNIFWNGFNYWKLNWLHNGVFLGYEVPCSWKSQPPKPAEAKPQIRWVLFWGVDVKAEKIKNNPNTTKAKGTPPLNNIFKVVCPFLLFIYHHKYIGKGERYLSLSLLRKVRIMLNENSINPHNHFEATHKVCTLYDLLQIKVTSNNKQGGKGVE